MKWCMAVGLTSYCIINCMNMEKIIINKNLTRESIRSIDYTYISRIASEDSFEVLESKLRSGVKNEEQQRIAPILLKIIYKKKDLSWQEFNISKCKIKEKDNKELVQELNSIEKNNAIKNNTVKKNYNLRNVINEDINI